MTAALGGILFSMEKFSVPYRMEKFSVPYSVLECRARRTQEVDQVRAGDPAEVTLGMLGTIRLTSHHPCRPSRC